MFPLFTSYNSKISEAFHSSSFLVSLPLQSGAWAPVLFMCAFKIFVWCNPFLPLLVPNTHTLTLTVISYLVSMSPPIHSNFKQCNRLNMWIWLWLILGLTQWKAQWQSRLLGLWLCIQSHPPVTLGISHSWAFTCVFFLPRNPSSPTCLTESSSLPTLSSSTNCYTLCSHSSWVKP